MDFVWNFNHYNSLSGSGSTEFWMIFFYFQDVWMISVSRASIFPSHRQWTVPNGVKPLWPGTWIADAHRTNPALTSFVRNRLSVLTYGTTTSARKSLTDSNSMLVCLLILETIVTFIQTSQKFDNKLILCVGCEYWSNNK